MHFLKFVLSLTLFLSLFACGDRGDGTVSKGHRDAIKHECKDSTDVKACGLEVRENFIADGNEFVTFEDLSEDQVKVIKMECIRAKQFGLETYNNCLGDYKVAALDGTLFKKKFTAKPKSNIEKLEALTVRIDIVEKDTDDKIYLVGNGSGVILKNNLVATNCHVALASEKKNRVSDLQEITCNPSSRCNSRQLTKIN